MNMKKSHNIPLTFSWKWKFLDSQHAGCDKGVCSIVLGPAEEALVTCWLLDSDRKTLFVICRTTTWPIWNKHWSFHISLKAQSHSYICVPLKRLYIQCVIWWEASLVVNRIMQVSRIWIQRWHLMSDQTRWNWWRPV